LILRAGFIGSIAGIPDLLSDEAEGFMQPKIVLSSRKMVGVSHDYPGKDCCD
jgi:hypothetical protein